MFALYKLQAKAYLSNLFNKFEFITTVLFLVFLGEIGTMRMNQPSIKWLANLSIIASVLLMMVMNTSMQTFGLSFYEMKESVLLKRIGSTKITKPQAICSFLLWGFTMITVLLLWAAIWVGIFQIPFMNKLTNGLLYVDPKLWVEVNWAGFFVAIIITSIAFYAIAFFFVSICKSSEMYQIVSTFYFFLAVFLGGSFTPTIHREWMTIISYFSPLGWGTGLATSSMLGLNVFNLEGINLNLESFSLPNFIEKWEAIGRFLFPLLFGASAGLASIKFFKWD